MYKKYETLGRDYPTWNKKDARLMAFSKCLHILNTIKLSLMFAEDAMKPARNEWWKAYYQTEPDLEWVGVDYLNQLDIILRIGFIQFIFAAMESTLRVILRALDPKACRGGTATFESIYRCLLKKLRLGNWEPLLKFLRLVRNTEHNNGVFLPESGKDDTAVFNGKSYEFKVGARIDFLNWELLTDLLNSIEMILFEIISHPQVCSLGSIDDPSFS
jgi:hypothetical protein